MLNTLTPAHAVPSRSTTPPPVESLEPRRYLAYGPDLLAEGGSGQGLVYDDVQLRQSAPAGPPAGVVMSGVIYDDLDMDASLDPGEPGIPGLTVYVDEGPRNGVFDAGEVNTTSGAGGQYEFNDLPNKIVRVRQVVPAGRRITQPAPGYYDFNPFIDIPSNIYHFGNAPAATVMGRRVFYNNSAFDGADPAANSKDDAAIATDKRALLPGQSATFANYTSYFRGINGVMVDVAGLPPDATLSADDFAFRTGNDSNPAGWAAGPAPANVTVRRGAGANGSDRVTITWRDYNPLDLSPLPQAVAGRWLQVTVLANADTGLTSPDVFYFGNAPGESGNSPTSALVNSVDEAGARHHPRGASNPAPVTWRWDYNRDRRVNRTDQLVARTNRTTAATALRLITVPPAAVAPAARATSALRPVDVFALTRNSPFRRHDDQELLD
jgi:hypothetical protein